MDISMPNRLPVGIEEEFNCKRVISDQEQKAIAFQVLQKAYIDKMVREAD
jgi:hypothetical protein